jgi:hypothetical protein
VRHFDQSYWHNYFTKVKIKFWITFFAGIIFFTFKTTDAFQCVYFRFTHTTKNAISFIPQMLIEVVVVVAAAVVVVVVTHRISVEVQIKACRISTKLLILLVFASQIF